MMYHLRPNSQRAKIAIILIYIVLGLEVLSFMSNGMQYNLINDLLNGGDIIEDDLYSNDRRVQYIGIIFFIAWITSGITFIMWFRRAYYNLGMITKTELNDNWAVWSWIVPVISVFRPYNMMSELYNKTIFILKGSPISYNQNFNSNILSWWWGFWIVNNIISWFVFRLYYFAGNNVDKLLEITMIEMFTNVIGIISAFLAIKVVKGYSDIESLLQQIKQKQEGFNGDLYGKAN